MSRHIHAVRDMYLTPVRGQIKSKYSDTPIPCTGCNLYYFKGFWRDLEERLKAESGSTEGLAGPRQAKGNKEAPDGGIKPTPPIKEDVKE